MYLFVDNLIDSFMDVTVSSVCRLEHCVIFSTSRFGSVQCSFAGRYIIWQSIWLIRFMDLKVVSRHVKTFCQCDSAKWLLDVETVSGGEGVDGKHEEHSAMRSSGLQSRWVYNPRHQTQ